MVTLVFLHGIGDGGLSGAWQTALDAALKAGGYPALDGRLVIAPRYTELLNQEPPPKNKIPEVTVKSLGDQAARERWEYERRQASLERLLGQERPERVAFEIPDVLKALV